jgi:HSP20 family protein
MAKKNEVALVRRGGVALVKRAEPKEELITAVADIFETPDAFVVKLDMPGSSKEGIKVSVESDVLSVRGTVQSHHREAATMVMKEIVALSYFRAFKLGEGLAGEGIKAGFEDGVLTLIIPKTDEYKVREIPIS